MYDFVNNQNLVRMITEVEEQILPHHKKIDRISETNQMKVLRVFQKHNVSEFHFTPSTGYGYGDIGRDTLEDVYADLFGGQAALVRPQIISGTHAIATVLFGILRPNDQLLYITGKPYDTLEEVIGIRGNGKGSLKDFQIQYEAIPLKDDGSVDFAAVEKAIQPNTKMIGIQRSKGYANRPSFTIEEIGEMVRFVKEIKSDVIVFVDNCYGEFVEEKEPNNVGVDIIAGSLIKNPGGGIVKTGGYIVGRSDLIELCGSRLAAPGIGIEGGASLYSLLEMYQGLFLAPLIVSQALKGAIFTAAFLERLGMKTSPRWDESRTDLIQSVQFDDAEKMIAFCQSIQKFSPIDSHVTPEPSDMPGYDDPVIMAGGTFIQGSSIELSADGPIRPPYVAYVQGGLTYAHVKGAVIMAVDHLINKGLLEIK